MKQLPDLSHVLDYKNPLVIKQFQKKFMEWKNNADNYFEEMLKYLWIRTKHQHESQKQQLNFRCAMHKEMTPIDEMWHTFILTTKDYVKFCDDYFGTYLHHTPEADEEVHQATFNEVEFKNELQLFLSYVYDHLGEETVRRWFSTYIHDDIAQ